MSPSRVFDKPVVSLNIWVKRLANIGSDCIVDRNLLVQNVKRLLHGRMVVLWVCHLATNELEL